MDPFDEERRILRQRIGRLLKINLEVLTPLGRGLQNIWGFATCHKMHTYTVLKLRSGQNKYTPGVGRTLLNMGSPMKVGDLMSEPRRKVWG